MSLNLSPRPGSAPSRTRAASGPPPTSPRFNMSDGEMPSPVVLPADIEVEGKSIMVNKINANI